MIDKLRAVLLATTIALGVLSPGAIAQTYPTKAVTFIVPFPAGGRTDLTARLVSQFLERHLLTSGIDLEEGLEDGGGRQLLIIGLFEQRQHLIL